MKSIFNNGLNGISEIPEYIKKKIEVFNDLKRPLTNTQITTLCDLYNSTDKKVFAEIAVDRTCRSIIMKTL